MARSLLRDRRTGSSLAEFGPALCIFFIFILIPLLDLLSFVSGVGTAMLVANWSARQAGPCNTFTEAQASILQTENSLVNFRKFALMKPTAPGATSGLSVRVLVTPVVGGAGESFDSPGAIPNTPPTDQTVPNVPAKNTMNCVYQYVVTSAYDVSPLFNFGGMPFLQDVPALGKPVPVVFTSTASVEHPEGLNQ